jgi:hypothetical protein
VQTLGAGIYDRLQEQGYHDLVEGVNFGAKALEPDRYANRRAEMWDRKRAWYDDAAGVQVPDDDLFQHDECSIMVGKGATKFDSSGRLLLESKDHIRERVASRLISVMRRHSPSPLISMRLSQGLRNAIGRIGDHSRGWRRRNEDELHKAHGGFMTLTKGETNHIIEIIDLGESEGVSDNGEHWRRALKAVPQVSVEEFNAICQARGDAAAIAERYAEQMRIATFLRGQDPLPSAEETDLTDLRRFIQFFNDRA